MTKAQRAQRAQKALNRWVEMLALGHWAIDLKLVDAQHLEADPSGPGYMLIGKVDRHFPSLTATVTIAGQQSAQDIAETIRHELLHLVVCELAALAYALADTQGEETRHASKCQIDTAEEHAVRTLERSFDRLGIPA